MRSNQARIERQILGPFHAALPNQMQAEIFSDGDVIVQAQFKTGFLHKGIEKKFEEMSWSQNLPIADRVDPGSAAFSEAVYCLSVEKLCGFNIPVRAEHIRVIICELSRIASHLMYISKIAKISGVEVLFHYVLRDRERILDLFELLCGSRSTLNYFRVGGVASDLSEGFLERMSGICDLVEFRIPEYKNLLIENRSFIGRAVGTGVVPYEVAISCGLTGPNGRASGVVGDERKSHPYLSYREIEFKIPSGDRSEGVIGDVYNRVNLRFKELEQSIQILRVLAERMTPGHRGPYRIEYETLMVPKGEVFARVESVRGHLGCHLVSDGGRSPYRVQIGVPSRPALTAASLALRGAFLEDLALILSSFDISIPEIDR